jgi:biopolymer transport protein ExbD
MRTGALALLMLIAACGEAGPEANLAGGAGNGTTGEAPPDLRDTAATLTLAASGPGNCSARWDDQPATPQQVLERSGRAVEQSIQRAGGVGNVTAESLPALAVVAPAGLAFACADTYLAQIRRAGVQTVLLSLQGAQDAALADFALSDIGAPPPTVVLTIGAGGRLTWNEQAIGLDAVPDRLAELSRGAPDGMEGPLGELELQPAREATFGQVHGVLRAVRAARFRAALLLPSVTPTRLPAPPVPPAPPPTGNQAAGNEAAPRP